MLKYIFLRYQKDENGAAAVEFSMLAVLFIMLIFGVFELGRLFWTLNGLQYSVEQAARYAAIHPSGSESDIRDVAIESLSDMQVSANPLSIQVNAVSDAEIQMIEVTSTYPLTFITLFFLPEEMRTLTLNTISRRPIIPE